MLKISEIFECSNEIPEFRKNSDRTPIWKVRMVRSLADRTFQLRFRRPESRRHEGWAVQDKLQAGGRGRGFLRGYDQRRDRRGVPAVPHCATAD